MTSRALSGAVLALLAVAAAPGCMETTVKSTNKSVLTSDKIAEIEWQKKHESGGDETKKAAPKDEGPNKQWTADQELEYYRAKSEKEPNEPRWHFECGRLYETHSKFELAEFRYKTGAKFLPRNVYTGPPASIGRVLAKQGKTDAALTWLREAVAIKPRDVEGYYFNPDYRESYFLIGAIQFHRKDEWAARAAFKEYLRLGGDRGKVVDFYPEMVAD